MNIEYCVESIRRKPVSTKWTFDKLTLRQKAFSTKWRSRRSVIYPEDSYLYIKMVDLEFYGHFNNIHFEIFGNGS